MQLAHYYLSKLSLSFQCTDASFIVATEKLWSEHTAALLNSLKDFFNGIKLSPVNYFEASFMVLRFVL